MAKTGSATARMQLPSLPQSPCSLSQVCVHLTRHSTVLPNPGRTRQAHLLHFYAGQCLSMSLCCDQARSDSPRLQAVQQMPLLTQHAATQGLCAWLLLGL